jgi:hypothetical protein
MKNALLKKPEWKATLFYSLITILLFCLVSALALLDTPETSGAYLLIQLLFLSLGTLHAWLLYRFLPWLERDTFLPGALATVLLTFIGTVGIVVFLHLTHHADQRFFYASTTLLFTLPFFLHKAFDYFLRIPAPAWKQWYYPLNSAMPDLDLLDLSKVLVIQFEFSKKHGEAVYTSFKAKAPAAMRFGELFFIFINDYNERHPDSPIQYLDDQSQPLGWLFYRKTSWWHRRKYFDPDLSFKDNQVADNDTIVCQRE